MRESGAQVVVQGVSALLRGAQFVRLVWGCSSCCLNRFLIQNRSGVIACAGVACARIGCGSDRSARRA